MTIRFAVLAIAVCAGLTSARAAQVGTIICPAEATRIVVLGDSLADGIWGSLYRLYAECETVETLRLTEVSDGLAKTDAEKWLARYSAVATDLDRRESDVVIVQIGANDITTIREGRSRESFATEAWNRLYADRAAYLTAGLKGQVGHVIWVGLPIVGKSDLEGPYQSITGLQAAAVQGAGGLFVDIHDLTTFGTGAFAMNGDFDGRLQQLRAADKVHFTKSGYDLVAREILDDLARITGDRDRRAALKNVKLQ